MVKSQIYVTQSRRPTKT